MLSALALPRKTPKTVSRIFCYVKSLCMPICMLLCTYSRLSPIFFLLLQSVALVYTIRYKCVIFVVAFSMLFSFFLFSFSHLVRSRYFAVCTKVFFLLLLLCYVCAWCSMKKKTRTNNAIALLLLLLWWWSFAIAMQSKTPEAMNKTSCFSHKGITISHIFSNQNR